MFMKGVGYQYMDSPLYTDTDFMAFLCFWFVVCIIIYVVVNVKAYQHKKLLNTYYRLDELSLQMPWVQEAICKAAEDLLILDFKNANRPICKVDGFYRASFLKHLDEKNDYVYRMCCTMYSFNEEFCRKYPSVKRCNLSSAIYGYVTKKERKREEAKRRIDVVPDGLFRPVDVFFNIKQHTKGDVKGCYVLHNIDKDSYYVGQSIHVMSRLSHHLTGRGNGDVYADYKYGNRFEFQIIKLQGSGYYDLNQLERDLIRKYNAYESGYNKTRGNGNQ